MAKAGFDPRESVPLWQNMNEIAGEAESEFTSTHPSSDKRIDSLVSEWIKVLPLYNTAHEEGRIPDCQVPPHLQKPIDHAEKGKG
jgi:predicted Zn-dependent protease